MTGSGDLAVAASKMSIVPDESKHQILARPTCRATRKYAGSGLGAKCSYMRRSRDGWAFRNGFGRENDLATRGYRRSMKQRMGRKGTTDEEREQPLKIERMEEADCKAAKRWVVNVHLPCDFSWPPRLRYGTTATCCMSSPLCFR